MKKPIFSRWLLTALAAMTVFGAGAVQKKFTAVTSNVDGLPPNVVINILGQQVANPTMNADGSQEPGATRMGQLIGENLWDIVALSEDFNYHEYILNGVSTYYNASKHRGKIDQDNLDGSITGYLSKSVRMNTDGLCLLTRKKYSVTPLPNNEGDGTSTNNAGSNWVLWNDHYGYTDNEADGLIRKGFRFYTVTLAEGLVVDVYITHMEAGSTDGDNAARAKQLTQFADYIKTHKGTNPIIILGDTNCRYTRDPLEEGFINLIEQDTDLTVKDPWVEIIRGGDYPEPNSPSIMVSQYGEQRGEVVDKIWYINNKKSKCTLTCTGYLHDESFTYADGSQIADHLPVVGTFIIDNPDAPSTTTEVTIPDAPAKGAVQNGQTYYLRNLGSGEFIRAGGAWTTQAVMGDYPSKFKLTNKGGNKWTLQSTHDNKWLRYDGSNYFVDQAENQWTLTQVKDNVYTLIDASNNAVGYRDGVVAVVNSNTADMHQQWEFLTQADLMHELYFASSSASKDVTFLMKAPDFGFADKESWSTSFPKDWWNTSSSASKIIREDAQNNISMLKMYNTSSGNCNKWTLSQTISNLPAGTYVVTYQLLTYNLAEGGNHKFTINGASAHWTNVSSDPGSSTVAQNMAKGQYAQSMTVKVDKSGTYANKIEIAVDKDHNGSAVGAYYDNFNIKCIGLEGIPDLAMYERVKVAIDDAKAKATEAGLSNYRNGQVETLWTEQEIVGDGWAEVKKTYKNLAEAVLAHKDVPYDYTYAIVNPSFELYPDYKDSRYTIDGAFPFGWSYPTNYAKDSGVWPASDANKSISNPDGERIFNTWPEGNAVYQEVTLTPGIYRLTAKVTSDAGNQVFLFAGDKNTTVTTTGKDAFVDVTLNFRVSDSKPFNLGVAGAKNGTFAMEGGAWYKADDFHLTRIGDAKTITGMEMLQLAINQATERAKALNGYSDAFAAEMARYQAMIDNYTLVGDGLKEFEEVYDLLRAIVFAQTGTGEVDYTYAIANNSFEWGNTYGWNLMSAAGDTGVKPNSDNTYKMSGIDGAYVFNSYDNGRGTIISQKINNLPAGHYILHAVFANGGDNDNNNDPQYVFLEVQGQENVASQKNQYRSVKAKSVGEERVLEFDVAEGTPSITIRAGGCNGEDDWDDFGGAWYKVDNFRLTRMGDAKICFFYKRLRDAINEANQVASELPKKYSEQWNPSDYQDLIDKHLADGHDPDKGETSEKYDPLDGSSGIAEINELFDRLRELIFSQTETGADMSGAIVNNSFELGDLTGWTTHMDPSADARVTDGTQGGTYGTEGTDGTYLYNAYYGDRLAHPIYQVIPNVPSGRYTLTVKIASDPGAKFFIGANVKHSDIKYITEEYGKFADFSFTFEVPVEAESKDVKIGVYPTSATSAEEINESHFADDAVGPWFKVDHFRLTLDSRYMEVDWEMESDTHGTIMLPFPVDKETLDEMQLEAYTIKMKQESSNHTPADEDINTYRLLTWDGPHNGMIANVPYVLKNVAPKPEAAANKVRAKVSEGNDDAAAARTYKFVGYTQKTPDDVISPEGNLLTGTLVEIPAENLQHHFTQVDDNVGFVLHDNADNNGVAHETVPAYHAYIDLPEEDLVENGRIVSGFYFFEPTEYLDWEMETDKYGTLILPFDAALPDGLKAYRLFDADNATVKSVNPGETEGDTYQLLNLTEVTETMEVTDEDGNTVEKVKLTANTPYLIELISAEPAAARKRAVAKADENEDIEETGRFVYQFAGIPINAEESYKLEGLMTGAIVSRDDNMGYDENGNFTQNSLDKGDRVLVGDAENGYRFAAVADRTALPRYHAYIDSETRNGTEEESPALATHLLFEEPDYTVEWTPESETFGTIVLPFAPETVSSDLEFYELTADNFSEVKNFPNSTDKTYQILNLPESQVETVEANKTYFVKVAEGASSPFTFTGKRGSDETIVPNGVMDGTYTEKFAAGNYALNSDAILTRLTADDEAVKPFHGYITGLTADEILWEAPDYTITWTAETATHGTLVLPFDVDSDVVDEINEKGYKVYLLSSIDEAVKEHHDSNNADVSYRIINFDEVTALEANVPYIVVNDSFGLGGNESDDNVQNMTSINLLADGDAVSEAAEPLSYTFTGKEMPEENEVEHNVLNGVYTAKTIGEGDHQLFIIDSNSGFKALQEGESAEVAPNHAYIPAEKNAEGHMLLLAEPDEDTALTGIDAIMAGDVNVDIYNLQGVMLKANVAPAEGLRDLAPGIYILRAGGHAVKVLK